MKKSKKITIAIISIIVAIGVGFQGWVYFNTYEALPKINDYVSEDDYEYTDGMYIFEPELSNGKAIMFYNGGLVDPFAYAYMAKLLADEGYLVIMPKFFDNLPIINSSKGLDIMKDYSNYSWIVMGHSLGGLSAAWLLDVTTNIKGIVFLASYPAGRASISLLGYNVLSIVGDKDEVLDWENYETYKANLPLDTTYATIEGGNHAYFGMYGEQKGDGKATITVEEQHRQVIELIKEWDTN